MRFIALAALLAAAPAVAAEFPNPTIDILVDRETGTALLKDHGMIICEGASSWEVAVYDEHGQLLATSDATPLPGLMQLNVPQVEGAYCARAVMPEAVQTPGDRCKQYRVESNCVPL